MNGVQYWRLKKHMSINALAKAANCCSETIRRLEQTLSQAPSNRLVRVADALGVTVDDLAAEYSEEHITLGDHPAPKYTMDESRLNPVGRFCRAHNISLPQYAAMTGKRSKQAALRVWTKQKLKPEEILPLAQMEGISPEELLLRYAKKK